MGSTVWSPLAMGILSGKYNDGNIPEGSRMDGDYIAQIMWNKYMGPKVKDATVKKLQQLGEYSKELGYTQAQVAVAWTIAN